MHRIISHRIWMIVFLSLFWTTYQLIAQCPLTKSISIQVAHPALPNFDLLTPADFFVHPEEIVQYADLKISFDQFVCVDLGIREVKISGQNAEGVVFSCTEFVWVYDTMNICNNVERTSLEVVGGKIRTETGAPVENVTIGLSGSNANYFKGSNEEGFFLFENFELLSYEVKPMKNNDIRNGITTRDLIILQRHILGILPIKSPYKLLAADLNHSGSVTAFDMVLLRQVLLAIREEFPNNQSWRFVNADFEFTNEEDPFADEIPKSYFLDSITSPHLNNSFIAIKVGDLDNSAMSVANAAPRVRLEAIFTLENSLFEEGANIKVDFKLNRNTRLSGMQFSLQYDPNMVEFLSVEGLDEIHYYSKNGVIYFSWTSPFEKSIEKGTVPLKLIFKAHQSGQLKDVIQLSAQDLSAEIYEGNRIISFDINWQNNTKATDFKAFDNFPNPFHSYTTLPFQLPENGWVELTVFNNNGTILLHKKQQFSRGDNAFKIEKEMKIAGIYFYRITSDFGVATGKMSYLQ